MVALITGYFLFSAGVRATYFVVATLALSIIVEQTVKSFSHITGGWNGLYVDRMYCKSSADSADDIYMVLFRGGYTEPFKSRLGVVGPGDYWDDFDDDEAWNQDIYVAKYYEDNTYVVALARISHSR